MMWFLDNLARCLQEREVVAALATEVDWLPGADWKINNGKLCLVADIEAHGHRYPVQMTYPANYPANPPTVEPREANQYWSSHQYGYGGELCLEWGPDNWHDEITGADMLCSVHKLLVTENPKDEEAAPTIAPSRHSLTLGQELRISVRRFLANDTLMKYTQSLPDNAWGEAQCWVMYSRETITAFIRKLMPSDGQSWSNPTVPAQLEKTTAQIKCYFFKTTLEAADLKSPRSDELINTLEEQGYDVSELRTESVGTQSIVYLLLTDANGHLHLFWISTENKCIPFSRIVIHDAEENGRLSPEFDNFATKTVGIVGLGSAGSKIALSLAKSGVRNFVLVDHDVFLPENICRHELTWEDIGQHKVDGVAHQLKLIAQDVEVKCHRLKLSGQEATASVDGVLTQLGEADIIIDATADSITFNQLSTVACQQETPMVWLEIFAGGIGGLIARFRPSRDPDPKTMRAYLLDYFAQQNAPEVGVTADYTAIDAEGEPLMASNADVAVIAENATRMALDLLTESEPSDFPYSMYLIGLSHSGIFEEPFHTTPLDLSNVELTTTVSDLADEEKVETLNFLGKLISKAST